MKRDHLLKTMLSLRLFDGEGGGAGDGTGGTGAAPEAATQQPTESKPAKVNKNPLADIKYGKQTEPPAEGAKPAETGKGDPAKAAPAATPDPAEASKRFEELIKGEYKGQFDERVQQIINSRFKEAKATQARLSELESVAAEIGTRYGLDPADSNALLRAVQEDVKYLEAEAMERGISSEQLLFEKRLKRENAELLRRTQEAEKREAADRQYASWVQQSEEMKQSYPDFDLRAECQNAETGKRFTDLLSHGVDVQAAYQVVHMDDILKSGIGYAVKTTEQKLINDIKARGARPSENGGSGNASAQTIKSDPSKWTKADREEVARRVRAGEKIEL